MARTVTLQGNADAIRRSLQLIPKKVIKPAEITAINSTIKKINTDASTETAAKIGVPKKHVLNRYHSGGAKQRRGRVGIFRAGRNQKFPYGEIYLYSRGIPAIQLGNWKDRRKTRKHPRGQGVFMRGRWYRHAWIMRGSSSKKGGVQEGNEQIFTRVSKSRRPLKVAKIPFIKPASKIWKKNVQNSRSTFKRFMDHEIKRRRHNARSR